MTNQEWVQNMLTDELVEFFQRDFMPCGYCDSEFVDECDRVRNVDCFLAWEKWLEAKHNESI